jgi:TPR repeat protein
LRKSLLIDTCHAGELDEDEKKILASSTGTSAPLPTGQGIAVRSVGTRGMNIKPIEGARGKSEWYDRLQGLFVDLRRGSGSTILSSSAGAEYALESSKQKNGLFTYAVLEALDGKEGSDANNDGSVTMSELAEYVKSRVATLTNDKQSPNIRRVNLEGDFVLSCSKSHSQSRSEKIMAFDIALAKADLGDAYAQAIVSIYYGLGLGCEPDPVKSKEYVLLSAKQQNPLGIYRLAEMHQTGEGVEQNSDQAFQLMKKAKLGLQKLPGDPYAMTALATIYERVNPYSPKIRELLEKASDMGYGPAQKKLSKLQTNK